LPTAPEFGRTGGHYLKECNESPVVEDDAEIPPIGGGIRRWAGDPAAATRLGDVSVEMPASGGSHKVAR